MTMSEDLFKAILAMDAYNRGYNAGIGDAQTGLTSSQIGNALVLGRKLADGILAAQVREIGEMKALTGADGGTRTRTTLPSRDFKSFLMYRKYM